MPQALPYIASAAVEYLGGNAVLQAAAAVATSVAVGDYQQRRAEAKARRQAADEFRGRAITLRGGANARAYAIGTVRMGVNVMYGEFVGTNEEYLDVVGAITHGAIGQVVGVYFDDEFVPAASIVDGVPQVGRFSPSNAKAPRQSYSQVLSAASSITLPMAPRAGSTPIVTLAPGGDYGMESVAVASVSGAVVNFTAPVTGTVSVDYVSDAAVRPSMRIQFAMGAADQAATTWAGVSTPKWTADHRLRGGSYARWLMLIDDPAYAAGEPQVSPVVRGPAGVWDPRTSSTLTHTSNPALQAAWLRTLPRADGGFGVPSSWINWASVAEAANICDELITVRKLDGSGYEQVKRYECHTVLWLDRAPEDNLRVVLQCMAGEFPFTAGQYHCHAGAWRAPTLTIGDGDVAVRGGINFTPRSGGLQTPPNSVSARFFDAAAGWVESAPPPVVNADYLAEDGEAEDLELDLSGVTDARQANYLMGVELERNRPALTGSITVAGVGANIRLLQTVQINLHGYSALAGRAFEVRRRTNHWDGRYTLELQEVRASTWALDADRYTPAAAVTRPDTSYLWSVDPVEGLDAEPSTQVLVDGTRINRALVTWTAHAQQYVRDSGRIELRFALPGGPWVDMAPLPGHAVQAYVGPLDAGAVVVIQARAVNALGSVGEWSAVPVQVLGQRGLYVQPSAPPSTGLVDGDEWFDTDDGNRHYVRRAGAWIDVRDGGIAAAEAAAAAAQGAADTASSNATSALAQLSDIASDALLTPVEKPRVIQDRDVIVAEQGGIDAQAVTYGVTTEKAAYDAAVSALTAYLATLTTPTAWDNLAGNTTVVGATFRSKFSDVYTTRQALLDKIVATANVLIGTAQGAATAAQAAAIAAQGAADTASSNATSALAQLSDIASDALLTPVEKPRVIQDRDVIVAEQGGIDAQAINYGVTTEKTAYDAAVSALTAYLATLTTPTAWDNLAGNTAVVGATFRSKFSDVYTTRQALLDKISSNAKARLGVLATLNAVDTPHIQPGASTVVLEGSFGDVASGSVTYPAVGVDATLIVTLRFSATVTPGATQAGSLSLNLGKDLAPIPNGPNANKVYSVPAGGSFPYEGTWVITRTYPVAAADPGGAIYFGQGFVGVTPGGPSASARSSSLRVEVIKR